MKRLLVLLLLVLMPLQLVWAASGACCAPDEKARTQHVCLQAQQQCNDDDGDALAIDEGCDCCHHFCGGALLASPAVLPAPERVADTAFDTPHYTSYIPDLPPPPKRPSRA
ncbi:hypothetical protein [Massilia agri]|uniref:DUF2946 domain-containing protein n=1 Tax=Massilia agri TaxID=1886785 RepID=A0ABT2AT25_9BURK|nr:hypothetical protein [Massilia agri]MCS0599296.1 hypothetical protein [Massilia agri]